MDFASVVAVSIVSVFFIVIMYKALKEPIDSFLALLRSGWEHVSDGAQEKSANVVETIRYD